MNPNGTERSETRDSAKRIASRAWDRAIRSCGYSNEKVACILDVSATRVRRQRSDDDADLDIVPSAVDVLLADHELGERFLQELRAVRLEMHGAPPAVTVEQKLRRVRKSQARVELVIAEADEDGVIDAQETVEIDHAIAADVREKQELQAMFRAQKGLIK